MRKPDSALVKSARRPQGAMALAVLAAFSIAGDVSVARPSAADDDNSAYRSRFEPFGAQTAPLGGDAIADSPPAYRGIRSAPRQFIEQPIATIPIAGSPALKSSIPQEPPSPVFIKWLPAGVVPIFGPRTPDFRKDRGIGVPLHDGGWRVAPFSIGGFAGASNGDPLIRGHVLEHPSFYGGLNLGWDYDHYWGTEKRVGFGALNLTNAQHQPLPNGFNVTAEYRLMYYPLGDTRWRPFITAGVGASDFYFHDDRNQRRHNAFFAVPFGGGLKYRLNERLALRIDIIDELTFGAAASPFHYVALTAGLEVRFGKPLLRLPWHKSGRR